MTAPDFKHWLDFDLYQMDFAEKSKLLSDAMSDLTFWHHTKCEDYRHLVHHIFNVSGGYDSIEDVPFIPVRLFKEYDLKSIEPNQIFKTMLSSGTSGQTPSKIYLDKGTASLQSKVLAKIMTNILGNKRLPMLVIDAPSTTKNRLSFSARAAGITGFSMFGRDVTYALNDDMELDIDAINDFAVRNSDRPVFIFGFTSIIWQHFCLALKNANIKLELETGTLVHGGGWKKLEDQAVDNDKFKAVIKTHAGIKNVVNYYGMVEQTGSIFPECEEGYLHAPIFSDIVVRDPFGLAPKEIGQSGLIEVLSILPTSYPGHALLTEDMGTIHGIDDCKCGRKGKYFSVSGRLPRAELRGCSDTYEFS